jgi:putative MATE family efflux protein
MKNRSKKKYEMDMCNGPILKKMLIFAIPLMLSSILQLLFNAADIIVVGRFAGDDSLAAVGSTTSLINLITNLFIGLSVGVNVLVARYFGSKSVQDVKETVHTAMKVSIISGIFLTIIGVVLAPYFLSLMNTPKEVLELASVYLRIYFLGITATMVYNFGSAILRAVGDTKRPLTFLFIAGAVNLVLNLLFVIVFGLGVAGVAIATVISQVVSAFLIVRCLIREEGIIKLDIKEMKIYKKKFLKILQLGLPAGIQGSLFSLSNVFIQSSINSFGETIIAGNSAASNIEGFVYVSMNAFYQAAISFVSQNVGAAKYERINRIVYTALFCVCSVGVIMGAAGVLFGRQLLSLYTESDAVVEAGFQRLTYIMLSYALCGLMDVMVGALRGVGYSIMPMIVSLIGACGLRILWLSTVFMLEEYHRIEMVYITYPISWTITLTAHIICFVIIRCRLGRKWKQQSGYMVV